MSQITTHILDTSIGKPASGVEVKLYECSQASEHLIGQGTTDQDGRVGQLLDSRTLPEGQYKLHFETAAYFKRQEVQSFYPFVNIVFTVSGDGQHYHVPLLLNPFGYSTYRGS